MDSFLKIFIAVVELKSFTKAAEKLHMTQPAVSQAVQNLEKQLGTILIERKYKSFHLNRAGEIVFAYAKETDIRFEKMLTMVSELKNEPSGKLMIGASYTIGEYIIPGVFYPLQKKYPQIQPDVKIGNTENIIDQLLNRQIDIGLVEGSVHDQRIELQAFMTDEMYVYTEGVDEGNMNKALSEYTWIIREEGSGTRKMSEFFMVKNQLSPDRILTFGSTQIIKEAIESGLGISLLSKSSVQKELQLGTIKQLTVMDTPIKRDFSIITIKEEFKTKTMEVFVSLLNEICSAK